MRSDMGPKYGVREITTFGFLWLVSTVLHGHQFWTGVKIPKLPSLAVHSAGSCTMCLFTQARKARSIRPGWA